MFTSAIGSVRTHAPALSSTDRVGEPAGAAAALSQDEAVPPTAVMYCPFCKSFVEYLPDTGVPRCPDCCYTPGLY